MATFAEVVRSRVTDQHEGLRFNDQSWTWAQAVQEGADRAALLRRFARPAGQLHLGVLLENVPDYLFWIAAAALGGAVVVGLNPTRRGAALARDIQHTDCDLVITEDRLSDLLDGVQHGVPADRVFNIDHEPYQDLLNRHRGAELPDRLPPAEAILLLLFSSGSTGAPKAVICSQRRLGFLAETLAVRTELTRDSATYLCMPLFHGNSTMMNLAPAMSVGATVCLSRKFSASGFVRDIHRYRPTFVNYVGRALSYVLAQPEHPGDRDSSLQLAVGTEASPSDIARFSARYNCRVSEGYGMSEGVLRLNRTPDSPPGSLGRPVGGLDVRVLNEETGQECPPAEFDENARLINSAEAIGQIVALDAAAAFEGYYRNPEAHAERVRGADFWTGDLAYRDGDGFFYFAGRSSDWIRVDSENFSAAAVERILQRWTDIAVAVVYAVPDSRTGDQVMCAVQMCPGVTFSPDTFARFLAEQPDLSPKWLPRFVRVLDEMPMTGTNKIDKSVLRQAAWRTTDPVFHRASAQTTFQPWSQQACQQWEEEFARHGRTALLPVVP